MIGQTVSHYKIVSLLGAGGMGVVYQAEDTRLRRTVALKFLPIELTQDKEARERLRLEAQAASALDHPHICTIHEIDETPDGQMFVAMSYYEGQSLKQRISEGPLPLGDAVRLAIEAAAAIAAAHEAGVIHRDIKPANIMLTRRGEVKLVDFGVAKLMDRTELTRTGVTFGTIAYMAPEYVLGQAADQQTDVWALGVVLYEMLAGHLPFDGEHGVAVMNAIANKTPTPLRQLRPDVPVSLDRIVGKALEKNRDARYRTMREMLQDLESVRAELTPAGTTATVPVMRAHRRRPGILIAAVLILIAVGGAGAWWLYDASRDRVAREAIPRFRALVREEKFVAAYRLMQTLDARLSGDPEFEAARNELMLPLTIRTTPEGADLYARGYEEPDGEWMLIGRSPLVTRGPLGYFRWRIVKAGYVPLEVPAEAAMADLSFTLQPEGAIPAEMVSVPAGTAAIAGLGSVPLESFLIDRYEVTNRHYKAFVEAGGYTKREYWREPFHKDGRALTWEEGIALLRDATGRHGPATWELSAYPAGQDDFPVTGVSWYEAHAYAAWAGKEVPTIHHWRRAAPAGAWSLILDFSNFSNKQAAAVGAYKGLGEFGTYDMAGNVREWCRNAVDTRRYILGGAWNQPNYMYQNPDALDPFDRSSINGIRLIKRASTAPLADALLQPVTSVTRDYSKVVAASDKEFEIYRRMYSYDPADLRATTESRDDSHESWNVERVSYAAAYGGERIPAYLFLPKNAKPPYHTVVYFPHSGGEQLSSFEQSEMNYLGFVVKGGRALLFPMYKGTYERRLSAPPSGPNARRDLAIARIKDLQRSVDFVMSRPDLDRDRMAFFGVSMGARLGSISLAIEKRFKTAVFWSGGFRTALIPYPPEIDDVNFSSRVTTPVLMLNGQEDFTFPFESSQKPMFERLGTPREHKKHVVYPGGHVFPFARIIKDTLDWFDKYLGVPK